MLDVAESVEPHYFVGVIALIDTLHDQRHHMHVFIPEVIPGRVLA